MRPPGVSVSRYFILCLSCHKAYNILHEYALCFIKKKTKQICPGGTSEIYGHKEAQAHQACRKRLMEGARSEQVGERGSHEH